MKTLEGASRDLVSHPARTPTPIAVIQRRAAKLRRRRGVLVAALTASLVFVLTAGAVAVTRPTSSTHVSTASPPDSVPSHAGTRFIPPIARAGDFTVLPITLANGDTLTLRYPQTLRIAELGFVPATGIGWDTGQGDCCGRTLEIRHGTVADAYSGRQPHKTYAGSDGQTISYFTGTDINYLVFQIGDWVVSVPDYEGTSAAANNVAMTDDQRATYAANLTGHQTTDGYLVLTPKPPLSLTYTDGPSVQFGDRDVSVSALYRTCGNATTPLPDSHGFSLEARDDATGTWLCYGRIPIVVHITGSQDFQTQVTEGLDVIANHQSAYG